ncbi:MAG: M24 family metallopeptidase [Gaiellaceae bacterium]
MTRRERALALTDGLPLLSADPATVTWLTGLVPEIEWGPSPFSAPPVVLLAADGVAVAVVSEDEALALADDVQAVTFPGFALETLDRRAAARDAVLEVLPQGPLAVELASLPGDLARALAGRELRDVRAELQQARAVKDADELEALRAAIRAADAGQAAARTLAAPGLSELELWAAVRAAIEAQVGGRTPMLADLVSGPRTAEVGGPPSLRRIEEDDVVIVDLVPRVTGYWGDSCTTLALGSVPAEAERAHAAALEALKAARAAIRPEARAGDVDAAARAVLAEAGFSYPHHTGHGVGLATHEEPRIVPGADTPLGAGMVVALEPGAYGDGWGVRVEQVVAVTETGHELVSGHSLALQTQP